MLADIVNKRADSAYKATLAWWEKPKALALIIGATAAITGALGGMVGFKLASQPPPAVYVQLPPGTVITAPPRP
jgi:hypothetical protein